VIFYEGAPEPLASYVHFVQEKLRRMSQLNPAVVRALHAEATPNVFWSVLSHGALVLLNFTDQYAPVRLEDGKTLHLRPFTITVN
jgi:hypothetical protein